MLFFFPLSLSLSLSLFRHVLRVGTDACLVAVTLMAALGHSILKSSFPVRAKQLFWGSFSVYMLLDFMYAFCSSPLSFCSAYMLSFFVIKFLVTFGVLVILNIHVDRLQSDLLDIPAHLHHVVFPKIRFCFCFFFVFFLFDGVDVLFGSLIGLLKWRIDRLNFFFF